MGKSLYFNKDELWVLKRCIENVDTADYEEDDPDRILLEKLLVKIDKAYDSEVSK